MFIRNIEVIVGGERFFADGGDDAFKIKFQVSKTLLGYPNTATITITNLRNDTIAKLLERGLPVEISAGHEDEQLVRIFKGDLQSTIPSRENTERETVITCLDGGNAVVFAKGEQVFDTVPVEDIVTYLAGDVMGLPIALIDVDGETGFKGRVVAGMAKRELDDLAREFGFSWSVQDGDFYAISDDRELPDVFTVSRSTGLQSAKQIFSGSMQEKNGVEIQALMNPRIFPNHVVKLVWEKGSDFPEALAGEYKVHNISFSGDSHGPDWTMNLQNYLKGGGILGL